MLTPEKLLHFLDREFRLQARDTFLHHSLSRSERVAEFICIPRAVYQRKDYEKGKVFYEFFLPSNPSKYREGDHILVTPYEANYRGIELRKSGMPMVFAGFDEKKSLLRLSETRSFTPPRHAFVRGKAYTIDKTLPQFFPTSSYPSWGLGLLSSDLPHGRYLKDLITGKAKVDQGPSDPIPPPPIPLGEKQKEAYQKAFKNHLNLIQGPPGTGKTYVISALALALASQGKRILITALTHRAINNALNSLAQWDPSFSMVKGSDRLSALDLDSQVGLVETKSDKKRFWGRLKNSKRPLVAGMTVYSAFRPFAVAMLRNFRRFRDHRPPRPRIVDHQYWSQVADYVGTLCRESEWDPPGTYFDTVIFDEASQLLVPHALLALAHSRHCIFVGDHAQLSPIVTDEHRKEEVGRSIFEHLITLYPQKSTMLDVSFRMNDSILAFPSQAFYDGKVRAAESNSNRELEVEDFDNYSDLLDPSQPVVFAEISHEGALHEAPVEAHFLADIACELIASGLPASELALIAPYRRQNNLIKAALEERSRRREIEIDHSEIIVDTVERMQGQEREVILVSLAVSEEMLIEQDRDFLLNPNRFNVLLTRAKSKVIVLGSKKIFRYLPSSPSISYQASSLRQGAILPPHLEEAEMETSYKGREEDREALENANLFKGWYFSRKEKGEVLDVSRRAFQLLTSRR